MTAPIVVRQAELRDLPRIAALMSDLAGKELSLAGAGNRFRLVAADPEQELLVACAGDEVVGVLAFRLRHNLESVSHYGEVASIVVDPAWRTKGVGRLLMEAAERLARERQCIPDCGWSADSPGKEQAHQFYYRLGFQRTGVRLVRMFGQGAE
jgi:GNAT superfamily N-acetyltransferase